MHTCQALIRHHHHGTRAPAFDACTTQQHLYTLPLAGGFFDNQTAPEERRAFLVKLLQESSTVAGPALPGSEQVYQ